MGVFDEVVCGRHFCLVSTLQTSSVVRFTCHVIYISGVEIVKYCVGGNHVFLWTSRGLSQLTCVRRVQ
jgi:hypothetical protein